MSGDAEARPGAGAVPVSAGVLFGLGLGGFFDGIQCAARARLVAVRAPRRARRVAFAPA
jgi:hypothetical protein